MTKKPYLDYTRSDAEIQQILVSKMVKLALHFVIANTLQFHAEKRFLAENQQRHRDT